MKLEEHERESLAIIGKPYTEIHLWLDEFAGTPECGMRHRRRRHHKEGLREAEKLFGWDAVLAARLHITSGWGSFEIFRSWKQVRVRHSEFSDL